MQTPHHRIPPRANPSLLSRRRLHVETLKPVKTDIDKEKEANCFAAHLLVPTEILRREYARLGPVDVADDSCPALRLLAKRFGVSTTLMAMRIAEESTLTA